MKKCLSLEKNRIKFSFPEMYDFPSTSSLFFLRLIFSTLADFSGSCLPIIMGLETLYVLLDIKICNIIFKEKQ